MYNQAMNGIGHEFGHYSTQDEIATKDQSVANYTGSLLENHTKKIESKPISEATWNRLLNSSSVITGPGAEVIASGIAVDEREYITYGYFVSGGASMGGNPTGGVGRYTSFDYQKGVVEKYGTIEGGLNFSNPDIAISAGIAILPFANSSEDVKGRSKAFGGEIDPIWIANIFTGNSDGGPFSVGLEAVFTTENKFLGVKAYISKSKIPVGVHGGILYGTKILNLESSKLNYDYWKNNHPRGGRNSWKLRIENENNYLRVEKVAKKEFFFRSILFGVLYFTIFIIVFVFSFHLSWEKEKKQLVLIFISFLPIAYLFFLRFVCRYAYETIILEGDNIYLYSSIFYIRGWKREENPYCKVHFRFKNRQYRGFGLNITDTEAVRRVETINDFLKICEKGK